MAGKILNYAIFWPRQSRAEHTWWINWHKVNDSPVSSPHRIWQFSRMLQCKVGVPHVRASPPRANPSQESTQLISLLELKEAFLVLETFLKDLSHKVCSIDIGQLRCNSLCKQQGRHPLSPSDVLSFGNLDMVTSNRHPYFSSACSWKGNTIADSESRTLLDSTPSKNNPIFSNKLQRGSFR